MPGFLRDYTTVATDWAVGSFLGATLDYFFNKWTTNSHILNTASAILQFTLAFLGSHEILFALGQRRASNTLQNTWILPLSIWTMSPNAVAKLQASYYAFHVFLYGADSVGSRSNRSLPQPATKPCCSDCADGKACQDGKH